MIRCFILGYTPSGGAVNVSSYLYNTSTSTGFGYQAPVTMGATDTASTIQAATAAALQTQATLDQVGTLDEFIWPDFPMAHSFANPSRSLDSAFQISTTRDAAVYYSVSVASTLSLTAGQLGSVELRYADDSGFTTNVVTASVSTNGNTGTLTVGLNTVQTSGVIVAGIVPAGKYVKLVSVDTTGTPTQTIVRSQEVLL
jgi:hypothetical protein